MIKLAFLLTLAASLAMTAFGHSIDYVASSISPAASFNGQSGNFNVTAPVASGSIISFSLTYSINQNGNTAKYPITATFAKSGNDNLTVTGLGSCTFASVTSSCTANIGIVAPATPGNYTVKINAESVTGNSSGLSNGGGIAISFTVASPTQEKRTTKIELRLDKNGCALFRQPFTSASATLRVADTNDPVAYKTIVFAVNGAPAGAVTTDFNGVASIDLTSALLSVGDHTVTAEFAGDSGFVASVSNAGLGVAYVFAGYQQPINADGSSIFNGRAIPVKVRVRDYTGGPVTSAAAHVFFAFGTPAIIGTNAEPLSNTNGDLGNAMRYDPMADQYIFNWDISVLANGTYTTRVDLGEGRCGDPKLVTLSVGKKK